MRYLLYICLSLFFLLACNSSDKSDEGEDGLAGREAQSVDSIPVIDSIEANPDTIEIVEPQPSALEMALSDQGLIDVQAIHPEIRVDLKYSSTDNFMGEDVYEDFDKCMLQPIVAEMVALVQDCLIVAHPRTRLLMFDCVRPRSVQYKMWEIVKGTAQQKYVAAPGGGGSLHNYGAAIDLGLIHLDTGVVDMGTGYDYFGELAQPRFETQFLKTGELTLTQARNRWLLRETMKKVGFKVILSEWWHFNAFAKEKVRTDFTIVE